MEQINGTLHLTPTRTRGEGMVGTQSLMDVQLSTCPIPKSPRSRWAWHNLLVQVKGYALQLGCLVLAHAAWALAVFSERHSDALMFGVTSRRQGIKLPALKDLSVRVLEHTGQLLSHGK